MYSTIISSKDLSNIMYEKNVIIFDCRFNLMNKTEGYENYLESHIENSHYINLESDLSSPVTKHSGRHPLKEVLGFSNILNSHGVNNNTQIIVYDHSNSAMCARFWWMLRLVGIKNCAVLDGGYSSWILNRYAVSSDTSLALERQNIKYSYKSDLLITTEALKIKLKSNLVYLLDARDEERYLGVSEPIDKMAGHIPGAINMPFKNNLDSLGHFKSESELFEMFKEFRNDSSKDIVNMCGSGVTACHNFLALEHSGIRESKIYVGSWSAWVSHEDAIIEGVK